MSDEKSPRAMVLEAHEEFIQHIERGSSKIRTLSIITIAVAALLAISYLYQLSLPYFGIKTVAINLADPVLEAVQLVLVVLTLLWLYVGVRDYMFTSRMTKAIKEARELEREIEKRITG